MKAVSDPISNRAEYGVQRIIWIALDSKQAASQRLEKGVGMYKYSFPALSEDMS